MSCRNRHGINDADADLSKDGGVVKDSEEVPSIIDTADDEEVVNTQSVEVKSRDVDLIAAEISTIDAISGGVPANGIDDLSDTTSVSDDTPPSTPGSSARGSSDHRRSRTRKLSIQDSHVSSSSSPARG